MNGDELDKSTEQRGHASCQSRSRITALASENGLDFKQLVDCSAEGVVVVRQDNSVAYANKVALFLLNRELRALTGEMFGLPDSLFVSQEVCVKSREGRLRTVQLQTSRIEWEEEPAFVVALQDVTVYRDSRAEAQREAERLERFLAILSHELRNPLGALRSAFELMQAADANTATYQRAIAVSERQFQHIGRLMNDLLDLSRITKDKLQLQRTNLVLQSVVRDAIRAVSAETEKKQQFLQIDLPKSPIVVHGDATRLLQVVSNLLSNAIRYTDKHGQITIRLMRLSDSAEVTIQDTGRGLDEELLPHIFDIFVQGDISLSHSESGLGIGLALVKRLIEMHNGTIEAENLPSGIGCKFQFQLPRLTEQRESAALLELEKKQDRNLFAGTSPSTHSASKTTILYAEDNQDVRETLREMLVMGGFLVHVVGDGQAAIEAAEQLRPDVILLDVGLPKLDGYQAARHLRQLPGTRQVGLIALTGYGRGEDKVKAAEAGFDAHLTKPIDFGELKQAINRLQFKGIKEEIG